MNFTFSKATKKKARLRAALTGPSGSGKTYTALELASLLGKKIAVIDTERGSASKYSDIFSFDVMELDTFSPLTYIEAIKAAEKSGYDVVAIDSLSHAWAGKDGIIELVDRKGGFTGGGWKEATPLHNRLIDSIIGASLHVIATMRSKTDWVIEHNDKGKAAPRKVGLAPVQRDGMDYEFDVTCTLDHSNNLIIDKTRCSALHGRTFYRQNQEIAGILSAWLTDGEDAKPAQAARPDESAVQSEGPANMARISPKTVKDIQIALGAFLYAPGMNEETKRSRRLTWASEMLGKRVGSVSDLSEVDGQVLFERAKDKVLPGQIPLVQGAV